MHRLVRLPAGRARPLPSASITITGQALRTWSTPSVRRGSAPTLIREDSRLASEALGWRGFATSASPPGAGDEVIASSAPEGTGVGAGAGAPSIPVLDEATRRRGTFYISNVIPVKLGRFDFRPTLAGLVEESLLDKLEAIAAALEESAEGRNWGWRVEGWEVARKDGGIFLDFSYIPLAVTTPNDAGTTGETAPTLPSPSKCTSYLLLLLAATAKSHGGFPSWLGKWYADWISTTPSGGAAASGADKIPDGEGDALVPAVQDVSAQSQASLGAEGSASGRRREALSFVRSLGRRETDAGVEIRDGDGRRVTGRVGVLGGGRLWVVRGRQWTEDMNRFPSSRLRVEFDGPDVSQEVLYELFRPYGRLRDIQPPSPVPAGALRYAVIGYSRLSAATIAINTMHGYSTPTNTKDSTLSRDPTLTEKTIPRTRLRIFYEAPIQAHAVRDWISSHPRIVLPIVAFLLGSLSYTFFDPIRAFFVRAHVEGIWHIEGYPLIKWLRSKVSSTGFSFSLSSKSAGSGDTPVEGDAVGKDAWKDRVEAEKTVIGWLDEFPVSFVTVTGPPGSGKLAMVSRALASQDKQSLVIDCAEIAKAKSDPALVNELANQTGYWPVFSFLSSLNGLIDLASLGLIGQKAGFSTPVDQQLKQILEVVGTALKEVSTANRDARVRKIRHNEEKLAAEAAERKRSDLIRQGGWHDGRLDCIAGNGAMSELGFGCEELTSLDLTGAVTIEALDDSKASPKAQRKAAADLDAEHDLIASLPILVLNNFNMKASRNPELWNVLAEWGAGLVENKIAHVLVVCDSTSASKALTRALPTKPLNAISLADANPENSLAFVKDKLGTTDTDERALSPDDAHLIGKLGGRMVDLETLVYKVRTGMSVQEAVNDIVSRNVVELRKQAFGDDVDDAKSLPWTRSQAWKVVQLLAKDGETSYANLLQDFPFKGQEAQLKALEEHDMIAVSYVDGRPANIRPGKPVFRYAFKNLVSDPIFAASSQIEYDSAVLAKLDSDIRACEAELLQLKEIETPVSWGSYLLKIATLGLAGGAHGATEDRQDWVLSKMKKAVEKVGKLEKEVDGCKRVLAGTAA